MKLELGCGPDPKRWKPGGYKRSDMRALPGIDYVCDARKLPADLRGKLTEIYGYHIMEHIPWREVPQAVKHWADWLAPGGVVHMISPDFLSLAQWLVHNPNDDYINDRVQYMSQGGQDYPENTHVCMTTLNTTTRWFRDAGLTIITAKRHNNRKPFGTHCPMITVIGRKDLHG